MDDKMRAHQAKLLLDNPVFLEALEQVQMGINREMDTVKPNDVEAMKWLVLSRQAANRIINHITEAAKDDKIGEYNARLKRKRFRL